MESEVTTQSEETQAGTSPEYVDLHEATDEELAAFLAAGDPEAEPSEVPQQESPAQEEQKQEPEQPKQEEKAPEAPQQFVSKEAFDRVAKQLDNLELLTKRRTSEIGELKRQFRDFIAAKSENLDEKFLESPTQALAQARQVEMAQQKLQELEAEEQGLINQQQAQVLLAHHVGPDGLDIEAIGEVLAADGMPTEFVQTFVRNPYQAALPETLIQLAKRATLHRQVKQMEEALSQLVPYTQKLIDERKNLPQDVLKNVQTALRQTPQVTGSAGGTGQTSKKSVDFARMTDAELSEFLKSNSD